MDLKCEFSNCASTFFWSGRGRKPHYCHPHRIQLNRQNAREWHRAHYRSKASREAIPLSEQIVRPLQSHRFDGPGLFEPLDLLFNRAITVKSHTLGMPKDFIKNFWIHGQAGQQFMKSFLTPDRI